MKQPERGNDEIVVHKQRHQPERLEAGMFTKFESHEVKVCAQDVRYYKDKQDRKRRQVTHSNRIQIGHPLYNTHVPEV